MNSEVDYHQAAGNLSSVCGVLSGFAATLIVLLLTPGVLPATMRTAQDRIIALLVVSAALYINGAGVFGNVPRVHSAGRVSAYNVALLMFLAANITFSLSLRQLLTTVLLETSAIVANGFLAVSVAVFLLNFVELTLRRFLRKVVRRWARDRK